MSPAPRRRPSPPPSSARPARRLLELVALATIAGSVLFALPPSPAAPAARPLVVAPRLLLDVPADPRLPDRHGQAAEDRTPRLRSVSTAPSRPRLGEGATAAAAPEDVESRRPVLRVDGVARDALPAVLADPGVAHATALELGRVELDDGTRLDVAIVDPAAFRPLAPRLTAESGAVWEALERGEVLLSPDTAARLGTGAGDRLPVRRGSDLPVGGTASNAVPPLVDAIAAPGAGVELRDASRSLLVANAVDVPIPALAERLTQITGGSVAAMPAARPAVATLVGDDPATVAAFEPFTFHPARDGRITIDPAWEAANIVRTEVPILGEVVCHRLLIPQLSAALQSLVDDGLADLIDASDYGGCYLPRHIDWTPAASLSMHAWGISVDVNVATNGLGQVPQLDPRVVEAFTSRGFAWGGDWRRPDGMHFELHTLLSAEELDALR